MKKSVKVVIIMLSIMLVLLMSLSAAVNSAEKTLPSETIYPESGLSESIFISQNNNFQKNENLVYEYRLENVPYIVSVPNEQGASVGTSEVYAFEDDVENSNYCLYIGEYDKTLDADGFATLRDQLSEAVMLTANKEESVLQTMVTDTGYINGFAANYYAGLLTVKDVVAEKTVLITGYQMDVPEYDNTGLTIAVISTARSTQNALECKGLLDIITATCHYDEELEKQQKEALAEAEAELEETQTELHESIYGEEETESADINSNNVSILSIEVEEDYESLIIYLKYANTDANFIARLYTPDKSNYYPTVSQGNGVAIFNVGEAAKGEYTIEISGDDCGDCEAKLSDSGVIEYDIFSDTSDDSTSDSENDAGSEYDDSSEDNSSSSDSDYYNDSPMSE